MVFSDTTSDAKFRCGVRIFRYVPFPIPERKLFLTVYGENFKITNFKADGLIKIMVRRELSLFTQVTILKLSSQLVEP
jgi:hypothetical protein